MVAPPPIDDGTLVARAAARSAGPARPGAAAAARQARRLGRHHPLSPGGDRLGAVRGDGLQDRHRRNGKRRCRRRPAPSTAANGHAACARCAAVRLWLRGRALSCVMPPEADRQLLVAGCRLGKQDVGTWLVSNGWARAVAGGPYAEARSDRRARPGLAFSEPAASAPDRRRRTDPAPSRAAVSRASSPRQRLVDQRARLGDAVERGERAEARSALLADQHLVDHLEEGDRHAGPAFRALLGMVLVALDLAGDVERGVLDRLAVGAGRQRRQRRPTASPAPAARPRPARERPWPASRNPRSSGSRSRPAGRARDASPASRRAHSAR